MDEDLLNAWTRRLVAAAVALVGVWGVVAKLVSGLSADDIALMPAMAAFTAMGILLVLKVPENAVSWLIFMVGAGSSTLGVVEAYGTTDFAEFVGGIFIFGILIPVVGVMLPLVFPTGRTTGGGWAWVWRVCWLAVAVMFTGFVIQGIFEGNLNSDVGCVGPGSCMALWGLLAVLGCALAAVVSFVVRWRRSRGVEREQLRWLVLPFIALISALLVEFTGNDESRLALGFLGLGFFLVPCAIGVAVLRYRLYEIDRIISRTVSYAIVVGLLLGVVALLATFAGTQFDSPLVVAATTLGVAAVFNPLRRRVQKTVDRRFNRSRYDAERVMNDFARSLRDEVNGEMVVDGWVETVSATMEPASVGVWVRP